VIVMALLTLEDGMESGGWWFGPLGGASIMSLAVLHVRLEFRELVYVYLVWHRWRECSAYL
jgi:hypothetical protein